MRPGVRPTTLQTPGAALAMGTARPLHTADVGVCRLWRDENWRRQLRECAGAVLVAWGTAQQPPARVRVRPRVHGPRQPLRSSSVLRLSPRNPYCHV